MSGEVFYSDDLVTLYLGDFRDVLPSVASADVAVVDPPYGDTSLEWDRITMDWLPLIGSALAPAGSLWLWSSMRHLLTVGGTVEAAGWRYSQDNVWEKHNGSSSAADRFRRVHEHAVMFYRGDWADVHHEPQFSADATARDVRRKQRPAHWGKIGEASYRSEDGGPRHMRSVMFERSSHGSAIHPTQKPLGVTITLLQYSCPPGGLVVAPFAGSGTDLLAARMCGRRAIGVEIDEAYAEKTALRLSAGTLDFGAAS